MYRCWERRGGTKRRHLQGSKAPPLHARQRHSLGRNRTNRPSKRQWPRTAAPAAGYRADGVYRSPRPAVRIESDPGLSLNDLLFRRADACPSALALVDSATGQSFTFAAFRSAVLTTAVALSSRAGVRRNDVILFFAHNCFLYPVCFFAVTALGAVATTASPSIPPREVAKQVTDSRAKLAITVSELLPKIVELSLPTILLDVDGGAASATTSKPQGRQRHALLRPHFWGAGDGVPPPADEAEIRPRCYTRPARQGASKGVILTHRNFISAAAMITADQDALGEGPNVYLCFLPMFHIFGLSVITFAQMQRGNSVVVMSRFDMDSVMAAVQRHRVTHLFCVPPVMIALAKLGSVGKYDLSSLRFIGSGAAPLGKDVMEAWPRTFKKP
ncbi:unnamed protein product [Miscanthus lutarioriparius]|uniref:AMP-dependent synthetase/ligase domain-containing protein n=1 Tax=Miscanthus lutarioriparius TaxID=422564 RepID=A0A811MRG5_9POAL|nr:unnamed protein product [Miscanthus lutarioriparius]